MIYELTLEVKRKIDNAKVVSFDVFDTLLFRIVNSPEVIFDVVGEKFGIDGFREVRIQQQRRAGDYVQQKFGYPHANIDEIYESIKACDQRHDVEWDEVKKYEIELERESLVANDDIREIYDYAVSKGKRIIAITDMHLSADFIRDCLYRNGFTDIETVYCSADERMAKYNRNLFAEVKDREQVGFGDIFHIGDNMDSDVAIPSSLGIRAFHYKKNYDENRFDGVYSSCIDEGIRKILLSTEKAFWYNFGVEVGGPVYMGLTQWLTEKIPDKNAGIYFISRDGYNACKIFKKLGYKKAKYLYTSRRALLLAGIENMDDEDISLLPPYSVGQSVGEILNYLCVDSKRVRFQEVGFDSVDSIVGTNEDAARFKQLYILDRDVFLERAKIERENAYRYFEKMGVFDEDAYMFDCGWNGTSQYLLEHFKKSVGASVENKFFYFGLFDGIRRRRQLGGLCYESFLDDYLTNNYVSKHEAVYEILFSAPHNAVRYYGVSGPCFEDNTETEGKEDVFNGISDYLDIGYSYSASNNIPYNCNDAVARLQEIITNPTYEEAVSIGNLGSVNSLDDFGKTTQRIAYITRKDYEEDKNTPIYWKEGFFKRKDIDEELKILVAKDRNIDYMPTQKAVYSLESRHNLENYYYWMDSQNERTQDVAELEYYPMFSVVMPVYNIASDQLTDAISSVLNQTYSDFELILVDDNSTWTNVGEVLRRFEKHKNVKVIYREENGHISKCTNTGLKKVNGDYVVFMDCDDTIELNALYEFAKAINSNRELDFIYSDEDKLTEDGLIRHNPFFKPGWSPDLFASITYTNHLAAYRTTIVKKLGGLRSITNGAQDYDFTLRFMEESDNKRVGHIAQVLYHWRERKESIAYSVSSKKYVVSAEKRAKEDALIRRGLNGFLEYVPIISRYRTVLNSTTNPKVSIFVIASSDIDILKRCIASLVEHTKYENYEIIEVFEDMDVALDRAEGQYYAFISSDVEIVQDDWLDRMVGHAELEHVGAVGAKLLFPNSTYIFHSGISKTGDGLSYDFRHYDDSVGHYVGFNLVDRDCLLLPGSCVVISKEKFAEVGGFDKFQQASFCYFDLCLRLFEHGYYNVVKNDVRTYCHAYSDKFTTRDLNDSCVIETLYERHPRLREEDPFLNSNLRTLGDKLDLKLESQKVNYNSIEEMECNGDGEVEIVACNNQIRITGWSSVVFNGDEDIVSRQLVITDTSNRNGVVKIASVPRLDIFEKCERDTRHLKDGFITIIDGDACGCKLEECTLGILTELNDGRNSYTRLSIIEGGEEARDVSKMLSFCKGKSKIYVYGAGIYGNRCVNQLMSLGVPVEKVLVTKVNNNLRSIGGVEVVSSEEINSVEQKDAIGIFVAVKSLYREQIIPQLNKKGFFNIMGYPLDIY